MRKEGGRGGQQECEYLWMYPSLLFGRSKLMTVLTPRKSMPRVTPNSSSFAATFGCSKGGWTGRSTSNTFYQGAGRVWLKDIAEKWVLDLEKGRAIVKEQDGISGRKQEVEKCKGCYRERGVAKP